MQSLNLKQFFYRLFELCSNHLFDDYIKAFQNTSKFLYIEHQYPFENFTLTYCLCEALKSNKNLKVIIVTAIKTDLPTGLVGELFDWSQDHSEYHNNSNHLSIYLSIYLYKFSHLYTSSFSFRTLCPLSLSLFPSFLFFAIIAPNKSIYFLLSQNCFLFVVIEHLQLIYKTAPERVGVYGLLSQDPNHPDQSLTFFVHSFRRWIHIQHITTDAFFVFFFPQLNQFTYIQS
jgi:hypothetical protein